MREKYKRKKKTVVEGEPDAEKKHTLPDQVGTTKRIPSLP